MDKYNNEMFEIDRPNPSPEFWKARSLAGNQLQNCFNSFAKENWHDSFFWIKAEPTYPSFDNLTFGYKNQIFSVLIDFVKPVKHLFGEMTFESQLPDRVLNRFLEATKKYNLVPCLFPVHYQELKPIRPGWNLLHAQTKEWLQPEIMATNERLPMSEWEISNFVIQIVRGDIEKEGNKILSFCDLPEVEPQIWFENNKGERCWVLVKHIIKPEDNDYHKWIGLEKCNKMLQDYDGFFAGVELRNASDMGIVLYRGEGSFPKYFGLKRVSLTDYPKSFTKQNNTQYSSLGKKIKEFQNCTNKINFKQFDNIDVITQHLNLLSIRKGYELDAFRVGNDRDYNYQVYVCKKGSTERYYPQKKNMIGEDVRLSYNDSQYIAGYLHCSEAKYIPPALPYFDVPFTEEGILQAWLLHNISDFLPLAQHAIYGSKDFICDDECFEKLLNDFKDEAKVYHQLLAVNRQSLMPAILINGNIALMTYAYWNDWIGLVLCVNRVKRLDNSVEFESVKQETLVEFTSDLRF